MVRRASKLLSEDEKKAVEAAVAEAEKKTSGEIVVVVATRSGRYDRGEDIFGVLLGLAAVTIGWLLLQETRPATGDWESGWTPVVGLLPVLGLFVGGFVTGAILATWVPSLSRIFVTRSMMSDEIRLRAAAAFHRFRVRRTADGNGILIYVSLFEQMVWVVGDDVIAEKIQQETWDEIRDLILKGFREKKPAEGLEAGVRRCGEILSEHFPIKEGDVNELTNEVRFID